MPRSHPRLAAATIGLALLLGLPVLRASTAPGSPDPRASVITASDGSPPVLVFMSWDGTPAWLLSKLLAAGKLPNVQRLIDAGARAEYSIGNWASKTASGHAAVFTGAFGDVNGITANSIAPMPAAEHTLADRSISGFNSDSLMAEPIWVAAARQGRRVVSVSTTQSQPFAMYTQPGFESSQGLPGFAAPPDKLWMVDGYGARVLSGPAVIRAADTTDGRMTDAATTRWTNLPAPGPYHEFKLKVGDTVLEGIIWGDADARGIALGHGTDFRAADAVLAADPPSATGTEHFSPPVPVTAGGQDALVYFRLYEVAADRSDFLLWRSYGSAIRTAMTDPADAEALSAAAGAFTGNSRLWDGLGKLLPQGGDGTAEQRYAETASLVNAWFRRATVWAIRQDMGDVYLTYSPFPDEGHHSWYGLIDPDSVAYDPALAARLWPIEEMLMADLDRFLGEVIDALEASGRPWNLALFSDHGFMGVNKTFFPNRVLKQAGLVAVGDAAALDLGRTKVLYAFQDAAFAQVNSVVTSTLHTGHKGGIVRDEDWETVVQDATVALLGARDPATGWPIVTGVFRSDQHAGLGIGGRHGGDLYLDLAPGYSFSSAITDGPIVEARGAYSSGDHVFFTRRSSLQSIAVLGGDQMRDLGAIAPIQSIDIAPTMAYAAGIDPPAQAQGHVLGELVLPPTIERVCRSFVPRADNGAAVGEERQP